ncbi:HAD family hydrolase [Chloroflexota bacterium]
MTEDKFKAVIWDMDGVIADTGPYHFMAWQDVFRKRGINFTEEDFQHNFGKRNDTIIRYTTGEETPVEEVDVIAGEKDAYFRRIVKPNVKPFLGVIPLIILLKEHGVKMAIASSAPVENIRLVLQSLGIYDYFDAIVWGREVTEGKPSPQGYLLAVKKLGVKPENSVVIEDAIAGVDGAGRAGMKCIAVTNTHPEESLRKADLVVDTLETLKISDFEALFNLD